MNSSFGGYGRGGGGGGGGPGPGPGPAADRFTSDGSYSTSDGAVYRAPDYEEVTGEELYSPDDEDQPYAPAPSYAPSSGGGGRRGRGGGRARRASRSTQRTSRATAKTLVGSGLVSSLSSKLMGSGVTASIPGASVGTMSTPGASVGTMASSGSATITASFDGWGWMSGWGGVWGAGAWGKIDKARGGMKYAQKKGAGGWLYWQYQNGDIQIADGPQSVSEAYLPAFKSKAWYAITNEIGAVKGQAEKVAAWTKAHKTGTVGPVSSSEVATTAVGEKKAKGLNALFAALGQGSAAQGRVLVGRAALEHGPEVAMAAEEYLAERKSSPALLQAKIAKYEGKYAQAKAEGNAVKAAKYLAKLQGLKARLASLQSGEATTVDTTGTPVEASTSSFPWMWVVGGGGALVVLAMLASSKKGG